MRWWRRIKNAERSVPLIFLCMFSDRNWSDRRRSRVYVLSFSFTLKMCKFIYMCDCCSCIGDIHVCWFNRTNTMPNNINRVLDLWSFLWSYRLWRTLEYLKHAKKIDFRSTEYVFFYFSNCHQLTNRRYKYTEDPSMIPNNNAIWKYKSILLEKVWMLLSSSGLNDRKFLPIYMCLKP